mgnify:CR=1 FL=1
MCMKAHHQGLCWALGRQPSPRAGARPLKRCNFLLRVALPPRDPQAHHRLQERLAVLSCFYQVAFPRAEASLPRVEFRLSSFIQQRTSIDVLMVVSHSNKTLPNIIERRNRECEV